MHVPKIDRTDYGPDATFIGVQHEGFVSFRWLLPDYRIRVQEEGASLEVVKDSVVSFPSQHLSCCLKLFGTALAHTHSGRETRMWMFQLTSEKALEFLTKDDLAMKTLINQFGLNQVVIFSENITPV